MKLKNALNHHWQEASHFTPVLESLLELHDIAPITRKIIDNKKPKGMNI